MIRLPYRDKDRWNRRTATPRHYAGSPLHLHQVEAGEFCAFSGDGVEIYVLAESRAEAKQRAQAKTPTHYKNLKWRK